MFKGSLRHCIYTMMLLFLSVSKMYGQEKKNTQNPVIGVVRFPHNIGYLDIKNHGFQLFSLDFSPTQVIGIFDWTDAGIRFTPLTEPPENTITLKFFSKRYGDNYLIKELFIPYSEISSVNRKLVVKTIGGKKHRFRLNGKYSKEAYQKISNSIQSR